MASRNHTFKDKKIKVWELVEGEDSLGQTVEYWSMRAEVWAHYRYTSGTERRDMLIAGLTLDQDETVFFTTNYLPWLTDTAFKISFRNKVYDIVAIDDFEGYRQELTITATYHKDLTEEKLIEQASRYTPSEDDDNE